MLFLPARKAGQAQRGGAPPPTLKGVLDAHVGNMCRGASLIRNRHTVGPCLCSYGGPSSLPEGRGRRPVAVPLPLGTRPKCS